MARGSARIRQLEPGATPNQAGRLGQESRASVGRSFNAETTATTPADFVAIARQGTLRFPRSRNRRGAAIDGQTTAEDSLDSRRSVAAHVGWTRRRPWPAGRAARRVR